MSKTPEYIQLRDILSQYYKDEKDKVNEEAVDVAIQMVAIFTTWDLVLDGIDADDDLVHFVKYVIQGALDGEAFRDAPRWRAAMRYVREEIEKRLDKNMSARFEEIVESIKDKDLVSRNKFYNDYQTPINLSVLYDVQMTGLKHLFKKTNPKIANAFEVSKWQFLSTIALFVGGPIKQFELGARVASMRDADILDS